MFPRGASVWFACEPGELPVLARVLRSGPEETKVMVLLTREWTTVDNDMLRLVTVPKAKPEKRCMSPRCTICRRPR